MPRKKKETHKMMGNDSKYHCGYEVLPDGGIKLAPSLIGTINEINDEIAALDMLLESVSHYYKGQMKTLNSRRTDFWIEMRKGIDEIEKGWLWDRDRGVVYPPPVEKNDVQD